MKKIIAFVSILPMLLILVLPASAQVEPYPIFGSELPTEGQCGLTTDPAQTVGTRFRTSVTGTVYAVRFYRAPGDTGSHEVQLWDLEGTLMDTGVATGSDGAWDTAFLNAYQTIQADQDYYVSVYELNSSEQTYRCRNTTLFDAGQTYSTGTLTAYGPVYTAGYGFPASSDSTAWGMVDVVFLENTSEEPTITPTPQNIAVVQLATGEAPATFVIDRTITYGDIAVVISMLLVLLFLVILTVMLIPRKYL